MWAHGISAGHFEQLLALSQGMYSPGGTRVTQTRRGAPLISTCFVSSRNRTTVASNA